MEFPPAIPAWTAVFWGALVMMSLCAFVYLFQKALADGKVRVADFGIPDLMVGAVLFTWFATVSARSFAAPDRTVTKSGLLAGGLLYLLIILGICGFLKLRKLSLRELFGLTRVSWWKIPLFAFGLLFAALPLMALAGAVAQKYLGPEAQPQEIVKFFQQAVQQRDSRAMLITIIVGGVLAPMAEELMFRGYFYGLLKRYAGVIVGVIVNSLLFGVMHSNLAALPALSILAVAFTLAYELTGCLLVPITMHALFNFTMFTVMLNPADR